MAVEPGTFQGTSTYQTGAGYWEQVSRELAALKESSPAPRLARGRTLKSRNAAAVRCRGRMGRLRGPTEDDYSV
jgi:hypothetical protein